MNYIEAMVWKSQEVLLRSEIYVQKSDTLKKQNVQNDRFGKGAFKEKWNTRQMFYFPHSKSTTGDAPTVLARKHVV